MLFYHNLEKSFVIFTFLLFSILVLATAESSIYEVLKSHGLPEGLLPKGVRNFTLDNSGNFVVHLDQACNAVFDKKENELHYERNVSGRVSDGQIDSVSGISAKDLFLWFQVKRIYVSASSSGVIYFDVGVVSKQFSLSAFDSPKECTAVQLTDLEVKSLSRKIKYKLDQGNIGNAVL